MDDKTLRTVRALAKAQASMNDRYLALLSRLLDHAHPAHDPKSPKLKVTPREQRVLKALGSDTLTAEALAAKMGLELAGSLRDLFAIMSAHGVLENDGDGYRRGPLAG